MARRTFAELLIDCEEDRTLRAVLVGMLRDMERRARPTTRFARSAAAAGSRSPGPSTTWRSGWFSSISYSTGAKKFGWPPRRT